MKYFLDSAKLDEIKLAYNTFGIDGVTTNPRHIMLSGKPFLTAITDIANWIKEEGLEGYEKFPVSVEINPHLDNTEEMIAAAKKVSAISENFVIKIPCTEAGVAAARRLEKEGIRTNVTLVFSPAQAIWKVVIPEIMPGIVSGFLMALTYSMDDFVISYFVSGASIQTLPVAIYSMTRRRVSPKINALSTIMFVVVLLVLVIYNVVSSRKAKAMTRPVSKAGSKREGEF